MYIYICIYTVYMYTSGCRPKNVRGGWYFLSFLSLAVGTPALASLAPRRTRTCIHLDCFA